MKKKDKEKLESKILDILHEHCCGGIGISAKLICNLIERKLRKSK